MEYIDLYLIHFPVSKRPVEEGQTPPPVLSKEDLVMMDMKGVWEGMEECQRLGLARAIGVSNFSCKKLQTLLSFAEIPPAANQVDICFAMLENLRHNLVLSCMHKHVHPKA